jgi:archaemetzincin
VSSVCVLRIGDVAEEVLNFVLRKIELRFNCPSRTLGSMDIPAQAFDSERVQYSSVQILKSILELAPDDATKIIGIADIDLYIPVLTFVFGQAQLNGKAAIVSMRRLRQEYYGLSPDDSILFARLGKEVLHELGHTFGMVHCWNNQCAMHFSSSIREIDTKEDRFCSSCTRLLSSKL